MTGAPGRSLYVRKTDGIVDLQPIFSSFGRVPAGGRKVVLGEGEYLSFNTPHYVIRHIDAPGGPSYTGLNSSNFGITSLEPMGVGMPEPMYLNATAKHCSAVMVERGQRIVRYQGEEYLMVGLYFARGNNGERELFYILRHSDGDGRLAGVNSGLAPSWRGDGR